MSHCGVWPNFPSYDAKGNLISGVCPSFYKKQTSDKHNALYQIKNKEPSNINTHNNPMTCEKVQKDEK